MATLLRLLPLLAAAAPVLAGPAVAPRGLIVLTEAPYITTSYPCPTPTTYTSSSTTYVWHPPTSTATTGPSYGTCPPAETSTATVTVTATGTASCPTSSSTPPLKCDKYGYLIQYQQLYRVDISSGQVSLVRDGVGHGQNLNSMAYNVLDNYLYAKSSGRNILRISADGTSEVAATLPENIPGEMGDIDTAGNYWYADGGRSWVRIDLRPGSATFGSVLQRGTVASVPGSVADWAYIPVGGEYLWSAGVNDAGATLLLRFSLASKRWATVKNHGRLGGRSGIFGALYGMNNGTLYASRNADGQIWAFPIDGSDPWLASRGPSSVSNDGARCVLNVVV